MASCCFSCGYAWLPNPWDASKESVVGDVAAEYYQPGAISDRIDFSANVPNVTVNVSNGGERWTGRQTIQWTASDRDLKDLLAFNIQYSPDNGESWTPISVNTNFNGSASWLGVNPATSIPWAITTPRSCFATTPRPGPGWTRTSARPRPPRSSASWTSTRPAPRTWWVAPAASTPISSGSRPTTGRPGRRWGLSAGAARAAARSR